MTKWEEKDSIKLKELCDLGTMKYADMTTFFPNMSKHYIAKKAQQLGIKNKFLAHKYNFDKNFLKNNQYEVYYWFGLLFADGCFVKSGNSVYLTWSCAIVDRPLMEKFRDWIKGDMPIKDYYVENDKYKKVKGGWHSRINVQLTPIYAEIVEKFGELSVKTYRGVEPKTDSLELKLAFIRGYLDGDGCVSVHKKKNALTLGFVSSAHQILEWILEIEKGLNLPYFYVNRRPRISSHKETKARRLRFNGLAAIYLFEILRKAPVSILERKWENPDVLNCIKYNKEKFPERFSESIDSIMTRNNIDFSRKFN
jgi:hypothetical protein